MTTDTEMGQGKAQGQAAQEQLAAPAGAKVQQQANGQAESPAALSEEQVKSLRSLRVYQEDIANAQRPLQQKIAQLEKQAKESQLDPEVAKGLASMDRLAERAVAMAKRAGVPDDKIARAKENPDPLGALDMLTEVYMERQQTTSDAERASAILKRAPKNEALMETGGGIPAQTDQMLVNRLARREAMSAKEIAEAKKAMDSGVYPNFAMTR